MYMYVRGIGFASVSTVFTLTFSIVLTVLYFYFILAMYYMCTV